jgi:hypothetical protein
MDSNTSSKKEEEDQVPSHEVSPRTSISSSTSNLALQSPIVINPASESFTPTRHSLDELADLHQLSRQALSRRLSNLSVGSSFSDVGEGALNWDPREAGINGVSLFDLLTLSDIKCA